MLLGSSNEKLGDGIGTRGISLPINIVVILVVAVLVMLVVLFFLGQGWDTEPINQTQEGIREQQEEEDPLDEIFGYRRTNEKSNSIKNTVYGEPTNVFTE